MDTIFSSIHDEARARIMWGEDPRKVHTWLREQGLTGEQSASLINNYSNERTAEIRWSGLKKAGLGLLLVAVGIGFWWLADLAPTNRSERSMILTMIILEFFGMIFFLSGLFRFIFGQFGGSLTELEP